LSGRGLCDELITRPEESYRLCCVVVCDLETSRMGAPYIYDISRLRVNIFLGRTRRSWDYNTHIGHKRIELYVMKWNQRAQDGCMLGFLNIVMNILFP